ncbi:MAG: T9SS type A sorting domain-containing protein [Chitinophagales bacterium]|nr:T9SS type A sorting domain-containing protein [Chitinophagales bacterium]MDW8419903.1 T9SS type A sorting domain-containing protein [Chitinophagales bacterium]
MMNTLHIITTLVFICYSGYAVSQTYVWAKGEGGIGNDVANSVTVDEQGNTYVAGNLAGMAEVSGTQVQGMGLYDVLLVKYGPQGQVVWIRTAGDDRNQQANAIKYKDGFIYVAGIFEDTCFFDQQYVVSQGEADVFIAKYDVAGNLIWVKSAGGPQTDHLSGIDVDNGGNVYVCGYYETTALFDTVTVTTTNFFAESFLASYRSDGSFRWVRSSAGTYSNQFTSLAVDPAGYVYFTGFFGSTYKLGGTTLNAVSSSLDILIGKTDTTGALIWLKRAGGTYEDAANAICTDNSGDIYIAGYFGGTATFGNNTVTYLNYNDVFVAKYNPQGDNLWVRTGRGQELEMAYAVACDKAGNVYATGLYQDQAEFSGVSVTGNFRDIFIVSYNTNGDLRWLSTAGGGNTDCAVSIALRDNDNVVISGYYLYTCTLGSISLPYSDATDWLVAEFSPPFLSGTHAMPEESIFLYPNPAGSEVMLPIPEQTPVYIYNTGGMLMTTLHVTGKKLLLNNLAPGVYVLQFEADGELQHKKLIRY